MEETLNKSVYLKHYEVLIILGLIQTRIEELREREDINIVDQCMLDICFMDIVKKLDPHNQENIKGLITKPKSQLEDAIEFATQMVQKEKQNK
jgi:hypothetical protein